MAFWPAGRCRLKSWFFFGPSRAFGPAPALGPRLVFPTCFFFLPPSPSLPLSLSPPPPLIHAHPLSHTFSLPISSSPSHSPLLLPPCAGSKNLWRPPDAPGDTDDSNRGAEADVAHTPLPLGLSLPHTPPPRPLPHPLTEAGVRIVAHPSVPLRRPLNLAAPRSVLERSIVGTPRWKHPSSQTSRHANPLPPRAFMHLYAFPRRCMRVGQRRHWRGVRTTARGRGLCGLWPR